jgi:hypothetical protein
MALPREYVASDVQLSPEEHAGSAPLYEVIAEAQAKIADGFQIDDLLAVPGMVGKSQETIRYILVGNEGDTSDDEQVAKRMLAVGFALVRASKLLDDVGTPAPE